MGLFLCHIERDFDIGVRKIIGEERDVELWFNGASDHLYELQIPNNLSQKLKNRLKEFQNKCLNWGHGFGMDGWKYGKPSIDKKIWAINEAKELLMEIDKFYGIKVIKGEWE